MHAAELLYSCTRYAALGGIVPKMAIAAGEIVLPRSGESSALLPAGLSRVLTHLVRLRTVSVSMNAFPWRSHKVICKRLSWGGTGIFHCGDGAFNLRCFRPTYRDFNFWKATRMKIVVSTFLLMKDQPQPVMIVLAIYDIRCKKKCLLRVSYKTR